MNIISRNMRIHIIINIGAMDVCWGIYCVVIIGLDGDDNEDIAPSVAV